MKKIGIVLSGGGTRGIAHLGILKALEEFGVKPTVLSGTSAGAIAGAFYAKGFSITEILEIVKNGHFFSFSNILFEGKGLFSMKGFEKIYATYFPENSFSELNIPLHVAATDILNGEIVYYSSGKLSEPLLASSCIPVVFKPIEYEGKKLVDGGVMNNFPIEPLLNQCDKIIGIDVNSLQIEKDEIHIKNILDRSFHLAISRSLLSKAKQCDLFIQPLNMSRFGIFDMNKTQEIFNYGYEHGLSLEKQIKQLLD